MKKFALPFFAFLMLLITSKLAAQNTQLSLSGTYGVVLDQFQNQDFNAIGLSLGVESKIAKRFSIGVDIDWQRLESELAIAEPYSGFFNLPNVAYTINRHQFNFRPTFKYYFKRAFKGFYVGAFGTYSLLSVNTSGYPKEPEYLPQAFSNPAEDFFLGAGLTYGFSLKLTKSLSASAFGSHQLAWETGFEERKQQNHQFGLGLNWTFKGLDKWLY